MKAKIRAILEKYGIDDYHWKPEITKELTVLFKELLSKAVIQPVTAKTERGCTCGGYPDCICDLVRAHIEPDT